MEEFQKLIAQLHEPFRTIALLCVCFGLRISECLALKWSDVDWLNGTLRIERSIVEQNVDDVKTQDSRRTLTVAKELLNVLKVWKQATQFPADGDWLFASPLKIGRLPYSYTGVWRELQRAAQAAGIGQAGHSRIQAHIPDVAGRCWNPGRSAATADAAQRHPNNHEPVWGCVDG